MPSSIAPVSFPKTKDELLLHTLLRIVSNLLSTNEPEDIMTMAGKVN